jgi:exonuclease VII small subunit
MNQIAETTDTAEPTELTFEAGYERLQEIAARLNEDEVPVSEMCDLFAEGKGLEIALIGLLDTQRERVEAIERGEGIRAFRINRNSEATSPAARQTPAIVSGGPASRTA